jgi:putative SOS response-associated peptidase YedK
MCGRFTLTWDHWRRIADALGVEDDGEAAASYRPRFNIAPTDEHFIITSEFERRSAPGGRGGDWSIVGRRTAMCINAKAETLVFATL